MTLVFVESAEMKLLLLLPLAASLGTVLADGEDPLVAAVDDAAWRAEQVRKY